MAVRHLSYLDLTPDQRFIGANHAREKLRGHLTNPFLTREQLANIHDQLSRIDAWERGEISVSPLEEETPALVSVPEVKALPPAAESEGQGHVVDLSEDISVDDS